MTLFAFEFDQDGAQKKISLTSNFSITLQTTKNLDDVFSTCRSGDLVFRVAPLVSFHEERWSPDNHAFTVRYNDRLEAIGDV